MYLEALARNSLIPWQNPFGFHIQANSRCLGISSLDNPTHDLTSLTLEILHLIRTFSFTDALLDHLPRSLRGNAPEICRSGFNYHCVAKLRFRIHPTRLIQQDFGIWLH